jgi:hypothetical protein
MNRVAPTGKADASSYHSKGPAALATGAPSVTPSLSIHPPTPVFDNTTKHFHHTQLDAARRIAHLAARQAKQVRNFESVVQQWCANGDVSSGGEEFKEQIDEEVAEQLAAEHENFTPARSMNTEERLGMAAIFLRDAMDRQDIEEVQWGRPSSRKAYLIARSAPYWVWMNINCLVYSSLTLVERSQTWKGQSMINSEPLSIMLVEAICIGSLALDIGLRITYIGPRSFFNTSNKRHTGYWLLLAAVCSTVVDFSCALLSPNALIRWTRPIRFAFLLNYNKPALRCTRALLKTLPQLSDLGMIWIVLMLLFGLAGEYIQMYIHILLRILMCTMALSQG